MNRPADFIAYNDATRAAIAEAIHGYVRRLFEDLPGQTLAALTAAISGGKCLRGSLLCLVGEAFGAQRQALLAPAVAIECIHAATLVHDDLIDSDTSRRGKPALWTLLGGRDAILLGDVILADALRTLAEQGAVEARIGADAIARLARGAYIENKFEPGKSPAMPDAYPNIIHLKTGVLFAAAAELGAVRARAASPLPAMLHRWGRFVGEAYQIADDLEALDNESLSPCFQPVIDHFLAEEGRTATDLTRDMRNTLRGRMLAAADAHCDSAERLLAGLALRGYEQAMQTAAVQIARLQYPPIRAQVAKWGVGR